MMMKAAPASAFVMTEPEFLLEFLIMPLNDPAPFSEPHLMVQLCFSLATR